MENLNIYKKIQIILLILIVIESAIFIVSIKNRKKVNATLIETVSANPIDDIVVEEKKEEDIVVEIEEKEDDASWDEQNVEDTKIEESEEKETEKNSSATYYIKINYTANCVTVYTKDQSGEYTVPVKAIVCSTGKATPTSGVYKMGEKYRWHQLNGGVFGQYCSRITGHILFHSVPYAAKSNDSLKYVAYDKLGTKASAGCIRLTTADALWIYSNCPTGTLVEFYSSTNPGPLGKPSAQKISSVVECRNWDPTDPADGNPWRNYKGPIDMGTSSQEQTQTPVEQVSTNLEPIAPADNSINTEVKEEPVQQEQNPKENEVPGNSGDNSNKDNNTSNDNKPSDIDKSGNDTKDDTSDKSENNNNIGQDKTTTEEEKEDTTQKDNEKKSESTTE